MAKGILHSILFMTCPRCRTGELFSHPTWQFRKPFEMKPCCPRCSQAYVIEPGFYWGAMYIAYMLSSALIIVSFLLLHFLLGLNMKASFAAIFGIVALCYVWIFRLSRSIWIHIFVRFRPNAGV